MSILYYFSQNALLLAVISALCGYLAYVDHILWAIPCGLIALALGIVAAGKFMMIIVYMLTRR